MNSKLMRPLVVLGAVAALGIPVAGADAHGKAGAHGHHGAKHGKSHKTGNHSRALIVRGTVSGVGDGTIDVDVKSANHHGRALRGQTVTFDVSNARIRVEDVNKDGNRDLADVAVGDRVVVQSRIAKGETPDTSAPLVAKRVVDKGAPSTADSGDETPTP